MNTRTITRQELEGRVLRAMRERFFSDDAFAEFCAGFREEQNRQRMEQRERLAATKRELARVTREVRTVIDAIKAGVPGSELKAEMEGLQARKAALLAQMATMEEPEPLRLTGRGRYATQIAHLPWAKTTFLQPLFRVRRFPNVFTNSGNLLSLKSEPQTGQKIGFWDSSATGVVLSR